MTIQEKIEKLATTFQNEPRIDVLSEVGEKTLRELRRSYPQNRKAFSDEHVALLNRTKHQLKAVQGLDKIRHEILAADRESDFDSITELLYDFRTVLKGLAIENTAILILRELAYRRSLLTSRAPLMDPSKLGKVSQASPSCELCGRPMELRENRSTGDIFWGCQVFPSCFGFLNLRKSDQIILGPSRRLLDNSPSTSKKKDSYSNQSIDGDIKRVIEELQNGYSWLYPQKIALVKSLSAQFGARKILSQKQLKTLQKIREQLERRTGARFVRG